MSKQPICPICGTPFVKYRSTQKVCGTFCAMVYAEQKAKEKADKEWRKETKRLKEKVKTRRDWMKDAQTACNEYIRERDKGNACISCDKPDNGTHQRHASHYRSVGACSSLRFHPLNIHASCAQCNNIKSGNIVEYRIRLVNLLGAEMVEWLESQNKPTKWTVNELKDIRDYYKELTRELRATAVQAEIDR